MITEEDMSTEFMSNDSKDQRQLSLLNDPNYGIILCFLEKFRSTLDLPNYALQRLEDHLLTYQDRIPPRLMDYHFILLKRLSLAKNTQREKFDSIITKFAFRFDLNDGDHLTTTGYLQADINIKTRILKNLLESQFDLNQTFKNTLVDKSAREVKSTPVGRDRFGVSYWLFMDTDCFVRLFREDVDIDRTWSNVAKNRDELENFIKLLITDSVVRKKFSDWNVDYEPFSSMSPSNDFEERYLPPMTEVIEEEVEVPLSPIKDEPTKKKRGRGKSLMNNEKFSIKIEVKQEEEFHPVPTDEEKIDNSITRKRGRPKKSMVLLKKQEEIEPTANVEQLMTKKRGRAKSLTKPVPKETNQMDVEIKQEAESTSDVHPQRKSGRPRSSVKHFEVEIKEEETETEVLGISTKKKSGRSRKSLAKETEQIDIEPEDEVVTPARRGRKRKSIMEENHHEEEESSVDNENLSVRRSSRPRKAPAHEPTSVTTSKTNLQMPTAKKKRSINGKAKASNDLVTTNKSGRSRRRRKTTGRRNLNDDMSLSSSSSDEHIGYQSDYDSDEYLPDVSQLEHDANFFELDEDNNPTGEELRTAKTAQASTIITACNVCSKSDRPEVLLLCDDCDDAYHVDCLRPRLLCVPDGDWYCPLCEHKKLSNYLIAKLKELFINFNLLETKRLEYELKKTLLRKVKVKEYSSDESVTASESEHENLDNNLHGDESNLSISQANENSNMSSSYLDDSNKNISQRGRHRRTRFDMNKMLNDEDESDDDNSETDEDDEYIENPTQISNFDLQIPKKMTRLLNHHYRPIARNDQRMRPKPIAPRFCHTSVDLNEKLGSPIIYVNGDSNSHQIKSVITNSNQTLKIVRRWNDVQRRNRLRTNNMKLLNETTSDCADENSVFCPDDASPPRSNDSHSNHDIIDEDCATFRSKTTLTQPANLLPIYKSSTKNIVRKNEVNFDRLTRDIQYAVSEANTLSTTTKALDQQQQHMKRSQKTNFSPYMTKIALRPLPVILPKPVGVGYKIFKSKDSPTGTSTTTDLSNIILTPSSSSSLLDANDEQSSTTMNT